MRCGLFVVFGAFAAEDEAVVDLPIRTPLSNAWPDLCLPVEIVHHEDAEARSGRLKTVLSGCYLLQDGIQALEVVSVAGLADCIQIGFGVAGQ